MSEHPFEVGDSYDHPKFGSFEVIDFVDLERMRVRLADGREKVLKIEIQARIWRNAQYDQAAAERLQAQAAARRQTEKGKTFPVRVLVEDALRQLKSPYSENVIDDVCFTIETDAELRRRYDELCEQFDRTTSDGKGVVNNWLGKYTSQLTNMRAVRVVSSKRATIISGYSIVEPAIAQLN